MAETQNSTSLVLGRGQLLLAPCPVGGTLRDANEFIYIGNSPEFSLNFEEDTLDHYDSDNGIKEKDESITLQVNRTGSLTTDNVDRTNLGRFFLGSASTLTQTASTGNTETFTGVTLGRFYQLGKSLTNITGLRGVAVTSVTDVGANTTYVAGVDYKINAQAGLIEILSTSTEISTGDDLVVTYNVSAQTRDRVISGNKPVEGGLMYVEANSVGANKIYKMPRVKIRANGDFNLKSDDWQMLPFSLEILKFANYEAIYVDGAPLVV
jgi:hypothetical protein